jgi:60 kDa SS-A/Ro ribonucleoprotein
MDYASIISSDTNATPQTQKAVHNQVRNDGGGYSFQVDDFVRLDRFLILGSEKGSYYTTEQALTKENALGVQACLTADYKRTVDRIVEISEGGRSPKTDPAIFALALAASDPNQECRSYALSMLPRVCRIGTHLFHFVQAVKQMRGFGKGLQRALSNWYTSRKPDNLAHQVLKYQARDGYSHRDILRLAHVGNRGKVSPEINAVLRWVVAGADGLSERSIFRKSTDTNVKYPAVGELPALLVQYETLKKATAPEEVSNLIREFNFTREMIPTQFLNDISVWEALLDKMPLEAMLRNLSKMTSLELIKPFSNASKKVVEAIGNRENLRKARIHPIGVLKALKTYAQGHGTLGSLTWTPDTSVVDSLNDAFYAAFDLIEPTGKNYLLALDVSGSMSGGQCSGLPLSPREGSAVMAMATARSEKNWSAFGYSTEFIPLNISPKQRLDDVIKVISNLPFNSTDCSLPMVFAKEKKLDVDVFASYTDSDTNYGNIHPFQALKNYREASGRAAKMITVSMCANDFSIADPSDSGCLDLVGFDSSGPSIIADFTRR